MCLIQRSAPNRYSELVTELKNASYVGNDEYPTTSADAYDLLLRRCNIVPTASNNRRRGNGLMFTQTEDGGNDQPVPGRDGTILLDKRCFRCQKRGHIRPNCSEVAQTGLLQLRYNFVQSDDHDVIPKSWILLDTCSTSSVGNNPKLVHNIVDCPKSDQLTLVTNGGSQNFTQFTSLNLFPFETSL